MFKPALKLGYAAGLCGVFLLSGVAFSQTVLTAAEMKVAAKELLRAGQPQQADALAQALLKRDPTDLTAHLVRARALRDMGQFDAAEAKAAWALSDTDGDRFASAMIRAQVLSSTGKRSRAQLWLRRAAQVAPNKRLKARAARDFGYVRERNPWSTQLSFTLAPNWNINNGSAQDRSYLNYEHSKILFQEPVEYTLEGAARAMSGFEIGGGINTRYRFKQSERNAHDLTFSASYRTFVLSNRAKAQAPDRSGSDFAFGTASLGYGYSQQNLKGRGRLNLGAEVGQSWYGGARYANYQRLSLAQSVTHSRTSQMRYTLDHEWQNGQATSDLDRLSGRVTWLKRRDSGNLMSLSFGAVHAASPTLAAEYDSVNVRGGMTLAKPLMGAAIRFNLGAEFRDYDVTPHGPDGRRDKRIFADMSVTFTQVDYFGFNPTATVSVSHTSSNIGLYNVNRFGINFGIRSAFQDLFGSRRISEDRPYRHGQSLC